MLKPPVRHMNSYFHEIDKETASSMTVGFHHHKLRDMQTRWYFCHCLSKCFAMRRERRYMLISLHSMSWIETKGLNRR